MSAQTTAASLMARWCAFLARRPRNLVGLSSGRALFGVWLLAFYLQGLHSHDVLWGSAAPVPPELFRDNLPRLAGFSVLVFSDDPLYLRTLLVAAVAAAGCVTVGLFTRASLIVSAVLLWSFHARNNYILDGGDNLGRIIALFMIAMNCSAHLSFDRPLRLVPRQTAAANIIHNIALLSVTLQLCVVYATAGTRKLMGPLWQNGTALYYVLRTSEFSRLAWVDEYAANIYLLTAATYFVVGSQCSFPLLIWNRRAKPFIILALGLLHLAIAYLMGLFRFSLIMLAALVMLLPDDVFASARGFVRRFRRFVIPERSARALGWSAPR